jgi:hypothetical protein
MKKLTSLELLMEYMEQNQYFIGNDLLVKYNELLQKEKKQQLRIGVVSQQRELLLGFQKSEYFNLYEQGVLEYKDAIEKYLA